MKPNLLVGLLGWFIALSTALPTEISARDSSLVKRTPIYQFYIDVTAAQHQTNFNKWFAAGYRMVSLNVYGLPPNHRYTAVWVQRSGSAWVAIHEASAATYQTWFNTNAANGFVTTLLSTTGTASNPIFAAVMEKNGVTNWYQSCGVVWADWKVGIQTAQQNRYILKAITEYGPGGQNQLYCTVYYYNDQYDKWTAEVRGGVDNFQTVFNSEVTKPFWRPYALSMGKNQWVESAFTDTDVGSWVCHYGMTASQLVAQNTTQKAAGRFPIHVLGGGTGSSTLFAAIFAEHDIPTPRSWRATGSTIGFQNNAVAQAAADSMMQSFMQKTGVRQAQFAVGKAGNVLLERAYSWSEVTRHTTLPTDVFLMANLSQIYLSAAIQFLYDSNQLSPTTKVYPLLGITNTPDPRLQDVTVAQLLAHQGGTDLHDYDGSNLGYGDVAYDISCSTNIGGIASCGPTNTAAIVNCMTGRTLDYAPGTATAYSNYGYILLSYVIEHITGQVYYDYLYSHILLPGSYDVRKYATVSTAHVNDPVTQESKWTGIGAMTPQTYNEMAFVFGGDGMCKEANFGAMSLASSASTIVRFIGTHGTFSHRSLTMCLLSLQDSPTD
ncbi:beta-lactamase/transpeptidase-like protein [Hyaloscypha sp. PMI_1271]|nr:beta-lactamase/transpeptidase-like protein [Hyaloscypha sp. PMI_1271]